MGLDIRSAEQMRNTITKAQQRQIKKMYEEVADEVAKMAKVYKGKTNISSVVRKHQLNIIAKEVEKIVDVDMTRSEHVRRWWPFLRDRRIDAYDGITRRFLD